MKWADRVHAIRRFSAERVERGDASSSRLEASLGECSLWRLIGDRGTALIAAYHEAGETDQAFEALYRGANALADTAAVTWQSHQEHRQAMIAPIRAKVELMYDEKTAERLMVALERACRFATTREAQEDLSAKRRPGGPACELQEPPCTPR